MTQQTGFVDEQEQEQEQGQEQAAVVEEAQVASQSDEEALAAVESEVGGIMQQMGTRLATLINPDAVMDLRRRAVRKVLESCDTDDLMEHDNVIDALEIAFENDVNEFCGNRMSDVAKTQAVELSSIVLRECDIEDDTRTNWDVVNKSAENFRKFLEAYISRCVITHGRRAPKVIKFTTNDFEDYDKDVEFLCFWPQRTPAPGTPMHLQRRGDFAAGLIPWMGRRLFAASRDNREKYLTAVYLAVVAVFYNS